jgi:hypothetical protein
MRLASAPRLIHFGVLALVRHARRELGWKIPATFDYLPAAVIEGAE